MKVFETFCLLVGALATAQAHSMMSFPAPRGDPNNPNTAKPDGSCIMAPLNGGPGCDPKPFPCGGYPPDKAVTQEFAPGQVFNVKFFNLNNPPPDGNQARHNGGLCEFSLSYDNGQTFSKIATYHRTAPDMFYDWPVKIPDNAPSGNAMFAWSWINALGNREYYMNCADVKITGSNGGKLPSNPITVANLPGFPEMTPDGDPANTGNAKGSGPTQEDIKANTAGGDTSATNAPAGGDSAPAGGAASTTTDATTTDATATAAPTPTDTPTGGDTAPVPGSGPGKQAGGSSPSAGASCSPDGQYVCASPGQTSEYYVCDQGQYVSMQCSDGKICSSSDATMIICG